MEPADKEKKQESKEEDKEEQKKIDPKKVLEMQLEGIKLDPEQKKMMEDADPTNSTEFREQTVKLLTQIKEDKGSKDYKVAKKMQSLTPLYDSHDFWDSQPVPKAYESYDEESLDKPIDEVKSVSDISKDPIPLPDGFYFENVDISEAAQANEVYTLLTKHYVEDDDNMFRFDYSIPFLQWALNPPGYKKEWLFGIRHVKTKQLYGFISGIPVHVNVRGKSMNMAEINFLCVHRAYRTKKMAAKLIREVTRRVNLHDIWQAIYTAGIVIPKPFSKTTYWHRSLNPKKLIDVRFSSLPQGMPKARYLKMLKLPKEPSTKGIKKMETHHVPQVHKLLHDYFKQTLQVYFEFTEEEVKHFFVPKDDGVLEAFVVEDP
jgi:glycylpeptide N-tetradecanoyltransferase